MDPANASASAQNTGTVDGSNLAQVVAQAVAAAVTSSMNEITAKLNQLSDSVSENIKKQSANDDTNFETSVTGAHDPYDEVRRSYAERDRLNVVALQALTKMVENGDALMKRSIDHFSALPPVVAAK